MCTHFFISISFTELSTTSIYITLLDLDNKRRVLFCNELIFDLCQIHAVIILNVCIIDFDWTIVMLILPKNIAVAFHVKR